MTDLQNPPFGLDTSCTDRLYPGRLVSGGQLLAEACYRRLTTERGSLEDDLNYGFAVSLLLGGEVTEADVLSFRGRIEGELLQDDRIDPETLRVDVTAEYSPNSKVAITIDIRGEGIDGSTFELALAASDVEVSLLHIGGT